ncbi:cyanophycin synthetase [Geosporobacter ferrireducens]|uniref:Cyanophycin synthetase n=1 Tax=Geosporobacter ferrireducens TaxID=1424294 RepID=A0A1D8GDZ8_9FIRM|nr:cyanophycin synthetase [Geosporobacter ferrireducens]AOT69120.1 cyanophycin synthetase [Geosporobacter ferrireducens]MTI56796.1 cyanophycin synthetase [Geosporobacter ferrireducens]
MKILNVRALRGRNLYSHNPIIKMTVDLEELYDTPTCDIPGFNERLISILPGLKEHKCSEGYKGGFVVRLKRGTYLAHVMEHTAIELQQLMGYKVRFGKARRESAPSIYNIIYTYYNEMAGTEAGFMAFEILDHILKGLPVQIEERLENIRKKAVELDLGPSTEAIELEARKRKIPVIRIGDGSLLQLGYGAKRKLVQATLTERASCISVDISCDKWMTNFFMRQNGIPVPEGRIAKNEFEVLEVAREMGYPVVVKPYNGNQGKGVSLNINSDEDVLTAYQAVKEYTDQALVEKYIEGRHYRILVVKDKVVAASERIPAHVVGDGVHTIAQLIEQENRNPLRGEGHEKPLTKIKVDEVMMLLLKKNQRTLEEIPSEGERVYLRENDNLSTGGIAVDVTDFIHEDIKTICVRAAELIELDVAGIDITTTDITKPLSVTGGALIEINAAPGIRMHHYPSSGISRNVAEEIVKSLFPDEKAYHMPLVSVTGTNGKTTTTRMIGAILKEAGHYVGMTTTGGIYINDQCIEKGDTTGPGSALQILMNRKVTAAVLETARGGIVNRGLGYDLADVGVITNITDDHLGIDGIETMEDLAHTKALIVEAIKDDGYAVINADDEYCLSVRDKAYGNLILFSKDSNNKYVVKHIKDGGRVVYIKDNIIYLVTDKDKIPVVNVENIPATYGGILTHNVENSLAAAAAAWGLGISSEIINRALINFKCDENQNPGRFNMYDVADFKVVVDYGHNFDGYKKVIEGLRKMKINRLIGVIGVPGDRLDASIKEVGILSGQSFDHIFIKEDRDKRGRNCGEVAEILYDGCIRGGADPKRLEIEILEEAALEKAMKMAQAGDIVIIFYEDREIVMKTVEAFNQKQTSVIQASSMHR